MLYCNHQHKIFSSCPFFQAQSKLAPSFFCGLSALCTDLCYEEVGSYNVCLPHQTVLSAGLVALVPTAARDLAHARARLSYKAEASSTPGAARRLAQRFLNCRALGDLWCGRCSHNTVLFSGEHTSRNSGKPREGKNKLSAWLALGPDPEAAGRWSGGAGGGLNSHSMSIFSIEIWVSFMLICLSVLSN